MSTPSSEGQPLLTVLARSIAALGTLSAAAAARRAVSTAVGYLVVAGLLVVGLGFLTFAGYRAMSLTLGSVPASLIVGCVYLVLGLVAALLMQSRSR